jgi:hypothetical protein
VICHGILPKDKWQHGILVLSLILTLSQVLILWRQTEILREQHNFQVQLQERQNNIQRTANWGELRNAMWEIMDQYPPTGMVSLRRLTTKEKVDWAQRVRKLLDSQIKNPILIQDKDALGRWRNAISTAKMSSELLVMPHDPQIDVIPSEREIEDLFIKQAGSILEDISYVWQKLILKSDEVSPTGGRHPPLDYLH